MKGSTYVTSCSSPFVQYLLSWCVPTTNRSTHLSAGFLLGSGVQRSTIFMCHCHLYTIDIKRPKKFTVFLSAGTIVHSCSRCPLGHVHKARKLPRQETCVGSLRLLCVDLLIKFIKVPNLEHSCVCCMLCLFRSLLICCSGCVDRVPLFLLRYMYTRFQVIHLMD